MAMLTRCDQCNKVEDDAAIFRKEDGERWLRVDESHASHDNRSECEQYEHFFCS